LICQRLTTYREKIFYLGKIGLLGENFSVDSRRYTFQMPGGHVRLEKRSRINILICLDFQSDGAILLA
jgi:hypothetical protein